MNIIDKAYVFHETLKINLDISYFFKQEKLLEFCSVERVNIAIIFLCNNLQAIIKGEIWTLPQMRELLFGKDRIYPFLNPT